MQFLLALVLVPGALCAQATIDSSSLEALVRQDKGLVILDVRTAEEFASGHLPGAQLLPFDAITTRTAAQVIPAKATHVVVYCRSGRRSALAAQTLVNLGYTQVRDLGPITAWKGTVVK